MPRIGAKWGAWRVLARFGMVVAGAWGRRMGGAILGQFWGIVTAMVGSKIGRKHFCSRPTSGLRLHTQFFRECVTFGLGFQGLGAFFGQLVFREGKDFWIVPDRLNFFFQNVS